MKRAGCDDEEFAPYDGVARNPSTERMPVIAGLDRKELSLSGKSFDSFSGQIDEVIVFDGPLGSLEISSLYLCVTSNRSLAN